MGLKFVHLHNHSEYSLLDGMIRITDINGKPSQFLEKLAKQKINEVAITDHGNMYGAITFYNNAYKLGIKPIIGCELYIAEHDRLDKSKTSQQKIGHLTALVKDNEGYQNLVEMLSYAHMEGFYYHPRIDFKLLEKYNKGIIFLSGCLQSLINQYIIEDNIEKAVEMADRLKSICGKENFFLELMDHKIADEKKVIKYLLEIAKKLDLEVVATNDCHYENKEDAIAHDVHLCISTNSKLTDSDRLKMESDEFYFKSQQEMIKLFEEIPTAISNTVVIASQCNLKITKDKIYLPDFKVPQHYIEKHKNKEDAQFEFLRDLCYKGLESKFGKIPPDYIKRLEYELSVIKQMGFSSYFLIVMDFIKYARQNNIPVGPGRGSGAGVLVSYALDITSVDPLKHNLLFERFLNPSRKSMPDLDIDFSDKGREKVIEYVKNKYGEENVSHIITYSNILGRTAIKDVGRVLGFPASEMNKITKYITSTLSESLNTNQELRKIRDKSEDHKKLFDIALKIEGLKRQTGIHAAGKLITDKPVYKYIPLAQRDGIKTTQYDGEILTELGFLKIDFLGLRTLSVIDDTCNLIKQKNSEFDINKIPYDDPNTFKLLCEGKTTGVFQLESEGMKKLVKNLAPSVFSDIAALVALFRPGPIQAGMIDLFVNRKHGKEKIVYEHPLLEDILKDTYGTIVYQEQVMEIAKKLAGFSPGDADGLRKAMGKKIPEEMDKYKEQFIKGCEKNSISRKLATKIFDQMYKFAGYGFNKSHSVAYATIAYQTAYLKANYPLEFMVSLLTSQIGHNAINSEEKENKLVLYIEEANNMGYEILAPSVNHSMPGFSIEYENNKPKIRFAFTAIKNIGESVAREIVAEREKNGKYKSINDFIARNNSKQFNKKVLESLAKAGAFDLLFDDNDKNIRRAKAIEIIDERCGGTIINTNTNSLFQSTETKTLTEHEILTNEKEVLGFYFSGSPLTQYKRLIKMICKNTIKDIINENIEENSKIRLCGIITSNKITTTKNNENMARFEVDDMTQSIGITIFPKKFEQFKNNISNDKIVVVEGILKRSDFSNIKYEIIADSVMELFNYIETKAKNLIIFFDGKTLMSEDPKELKELKKLFENPNNSGNTRVYFVINSMNKNTYTIETIINIRLTKHIINKIEEITGVGRWKINIEY